MKKTMIILLIMFFYASGCAVLSLPINSDENIKPQSGFRFGVKWYLDQKGTLFTWGYDGCNAGMAESKFYKTSLGQGSGVLYNNIPTKVYEDVKYISWGSYQGLTADGDMIMWGDPFIEKAALTEIEIVRNGNIEVMKNSFYITADKKLYARYDIEHVGQSKSYNNEDTLIMENVVDSATTYRQLVLKENGELWAFRIDHSTFEFVESPKKILKGVKKIIHNANAALLLKKDGSLWFYGNNEFGQCGNGEHGDLSYNTEDSVVTVPYKIMEHVKDAWLSASAAYAVTEDGGLYGWGLNDYDLILTGEKYSLPNDTDRSFVTEPKHIMDNVRETFCGNATALFVIKTDGSVWSWGLANSGVLGHEMTEVEKSDSYAVSMPVKILEGIERIFGTGGALIFAQKTDGKVFYWGNDDVCSNVGNEWDNVIKNQEGKGIFYIKRYNIPTPIEFSVDTYFQTALDYIAAQPGADISQYQAARYIEK